MACKRLAAMSPCDFAAKLEERVQDVMPPVASEWRDEGGVLTRE